MSEILRLGTAPQGYVRIHAQKKEAEAIALAVVLRDGEGRAVCIVACGKRGYHVYAKARA